MEAGAAMVEAGLARKSSKTPSCAKEVNTRFEWDVNDANRANSSMEGSMSKKRAMMVREWERHADVEERERVVAGWRVELK